MTDSEATHRQGHCVGSHHEVHDDNFAEANKDFFNAPGFAERYAERPDAVECAQRLAGAMLREYPFDEEKTSIMDFACGVGLISRELAPHSKSIVGVDISQRMVDLYNLSVHNQGISPDEMRAICISAIKENEEQLQGMAFDVIVCASAYHHLASIDDVTKILATYLKPGGSLLVTDLIKDHSSQDVFPHNAQHIVPHRDGFTEDEIHNAFSSAGLHNFHFKEIARATAKHAGQPVTFFLARGDK
ncbi:S-adenosyl-L-methionine-dependent methyltransferase [Scleroderma yunnanense]